MLHVSLWVAPVVCAASVADPPWQPAAPTIAFAVRSTSPTDQQFLRFRKAAAEIADSVHGGRYAMFAMVDVGDTFTHEPAARRWEQLLGRDHVFRFNETSMTLRYPAAFTELRKVTPPWQSTTMCLHVETICALALELIAVTHPTVQALWVAEQDTAFTGNVASYIRQYERAGSIPPLVADLIVPNEPFQMFKGGPAFSRVTKSFTAQFGSYRARADEFLRGWSMRTLRFLDVLSAKRGISSYSEAGPVTILTHEATRTQNFSMGVLSSRHKGVPARAKNGRNDEMRKHKWNQALAHDQRAECATAVNFSACVRNMVGRVYHPVKF